MKVLFFSDIHDEKYISLLRKKAKNVDLIVCAGDISNFSHNLDKILAQLNRFGKKMLMIHGNHEDPPSKLAELCNKYKNIDFFHGQERVVKNVRFIGWGGGGFSRIDKGLEVFLKSLKQENKERERKGMIKKEKLVLVTHANPRRTKLDMLWHHVGCQTIRKAINQLQPVIAVSGHIHENAGVEDYIKQTKCINLLPEGIIITL